MKKLFISKGVLLFLCLFFILSATFFAYANPPAKQAEKTLTIRELLEHPFYWDQRSINLTGEVIGQVLFSGDQACIHLLDHEGNLIGVWMDRKLQEKISCYGKHGIKGDTVKVEGIFHEICTQHSGDTDHHATKISIVEAGSILPPAKVVWTRLWVSLLILVILSFMYLRFKQRKSQFSE